MEEVDVVVDAGVVVDDVVADVAGVGVVADVGEVVDIVVDWVARMDFAKFSHVRYFAILLFLTFHESLGFNTYIMLWMYPRCYTLAIDYTKQ